jgi:predicted transcriptional regulator
MIIDVTVSVTDVVYERVQRLARARHQDLSSFLADALDIGVIQVESQSSDRQESPEDAALDREMQAYIALHPMLKEKYFGKYVAVYQGKLVDVADDLGTLHERIHALYPKQIVWIAQVKAEPIETLYVRSPRLLHEGADN